jgi:hypothetical protein
MTMRRVFGKRAVMALGVVAAMPVALAHAQDKGGAAPAAPPPPAVTVYVPPPAAPTPAPPRSMESGLPSSSRALSAGSNTSDGFDLGGTTGGTGTVRGDANSAGVFEAYAQRVPSYHTVRRGDTLWEITGYYFHNPWMWPKVWTYNPSIQNPHWIYPGDRLKLRTDGGDDRTTATLGTGMTLRRQTIPRDTVFLRDEGFVDDERRDVWGEVSGSPEDRMMLGDHDTVYLEIKKDHEPRPDQELTVFRSIRATSGAKGSIVQILGTVRIEKYDADKHIARGRIVESLDVIERGARIGPIGRRFDVVPPVRNKDDLSVRVIASVWPRVFHGQNQVVYINKGSDDGVVAGNRFFVLRRGDPWRSTLSGSGDLSDKTVRSTSELGPDTESVRGTDRDKDYPDEVVAEMRVLKTREKTAACIVTSSKLEIAEGDLAVARKGY